MTPSLEGSPTKAKEAPSHHEVRLAPLDTNPVFARECSISEEIDTEYEHEQEREHLELAKNTER